MSDEKSKISYSGVVLKDTSHQRLVKRFEKLIPQDWEIKAHHVTMNMGPLAPEFEKYLGFVVSINAVSFAMDDMVAAVGVTGIPSKNAQPHITLAINKKAGAQAKMSNDLKDWKPLKRPIMLSGSVEEVPHPIFQKKLEKGEEEEKDGEE